MSGLNSGDAPSGDQTFVFADLSGYTALTEAHGDEEAAELVAEFGAAAGALAAESSAEVVKSIGDALMIRSGDAGAAVRLGVRIVREIGATHGFPSVRVGMHTGPAVERGGDWFGGAVNLAARVSGAAAGGEVLLTDATRTAAGEVEGVEFHERGRQELRNIAEPVTLYGALGEAAHSTEDLPIDPVCRMAVDPEHSAGRLVHGGVTYHFCSLHCAAEFAANPQRYADG